MGKTKGTLGCVLAAMLALAAPDRGAACAFHGYTPDPTLVDRLLATEQVVIARLSGPDGQRYVPVETLLGPPVAEIPIAVDARTRARVAQNPAGTVLLARDGSYGPWMPVAVLDPGYRAVVEQVVARQSAWQLGRDRDRSRIFAKRLNDPNPALRHLALQEMDRMPYADLRALRLPRIVGLQQDVQTGDPELRPIRVLLAGLSGDRGYTPYLAGALDLAIARETPYLGAYATALIELEGRAGVAHVIGRITRNAQSDSVVTERLFEALALQYKSGPGAVRRSITRSVAELVRSNPAFEEVAARQFGFDGGWRRGN
ncbi:hypothetical protein [Cognatishimia sp. F0-27]|uniref:hypothetical protein n=1 Tax=Cognatishimia sp. F0-27 TaxID=2816855 RepID=UPI001D0C74D7|nr:hypothetical protein [Cognatishimia sp. F0-27]MCC1492257.1 hypothetical protein [Cognatishimia sp. F0-27]